MAATLAPIQTVKVPPPAVDIATPQWLSRALVVVWLLGVAFVVFAIVAAQAHRRALDMIANQSARSVIAAQRMASALADMDANAANELLNPQAKDITIRAYEDARKRMAEALVDAARNITFDGEEREIKALAQNNAIYSARVQAAFTAQDSGGAAGAALTQYKVAADLLDKSLLPGARKVDEINRGELDKSYAEIQTSSTIQSVLVWISGLGMIAVMLRIQFFLSDRMRRTLNPLCALATALTLGLLLYTNHALSGTSHEIGVVKNDAFDSIHKLWQAKALAFQANAVESRYLLDRKSADQHEARFRTGVTQVKGLLAEELKNITFDGERDAAKKANEWWLKYLAIDDRIRNYEQKGQHDLALKLCLGEGEDESNGAFDAFIKFVDKTVDINQAEFDKAAKRGFDALANFEYVAPIVGLLAALACLFGVLPRIKEYSV